MTSSRCDPFWVESPSILWSRWQDFFPFTEAAKKCTSTALNSFTRFGIYLGLALAILYRDGMYLGLTLGFAALAVAAFYGMKSGGKLREGFANTVVTPTLVAGGAETSLVGGIEAADRPLADVIGEGDRTQPTAANPFMNVLVNEVLDNPQKAPAANVDTPEMGRRLSDEFQTRMYGDPTDVFQHTQDQRVWSAMPITSIPNDQGAFANWLYRVPGRTCKEGNNAACRTGTEGGVVTWLSSP
jgi:hypothetical protein